jgi:arylsulfatase A-like enzyme
MRMTSAPLLAAFALVACGRDAGEAPPNVVLIVVDTLRADHAGPQSMPALEQLARDGVRFEQAFSHAPSTLPSHASLFSSRPSFENDVKINAQTLPAGLRTLPQWLGRLGYRTAAAISMASLWPIEPGTGFDREFASYVYDGFVDLWPAERVTDESAGLLDTLADAAPFLLFAHYSDPHEPYNAHGTAARAVDVLLDGEPFETIGASEFGFVRVAVELEPGRHEIAFRSDAPFRLRLFEPRTEKGLLPVRFTSGRPMDELTALAGEIAQPEPARVLSEFWIWVQDAPDEAETRARYALEAAHADREIGRLLDALRARGLYDSSWIVLLSDHGEALGEHGLTGHVDTLYDELLHVPLVIKPPSGSPHLAALRAPAGAQVRLIDVAPTLLAGLGLPPLPDAQGASLLDGVPDGPLLAETHAPAAPRTLFCLRDGRHKLIFAPQARDGAPERFELYDLESDPGELEDVFASRGAEFAGWQAELRRIAELSAARGTATPTVNESAAARLKALGY